MRWLLFLGLLTAATVGGQRSLLAEFQRDAANYLRDRMDDERKSANRNTEGEDPAAARVFGFLQTTPFIKKTGYTALQQLRIIQEYQKITGLRGRFLWKNLTSIFDKGTIFDSCGRNTLMPDSRRSLLLAGGFLLSACCPYQPISCNNAKRYRTMDGSCNCATDKDMGRSNRAYRRMIKPDYGDTVSTPRAAKNGSPLPSARAVSNAIYESMDVSAKFSGILTVFHMSLGQIMDHDTDRTPINQLMQPNGTLVPLKCGKDGCDNSAPADKECFPIPIPENDPYFKKKCFKFVRSQAFMADGCQIGPREQANVLTSWLDASFIYGSTKAENDPIRELSESRGQMKQIRNPVAPACGPLIPTKVDSGCRDLTDKVKCFHTGDKRQNEQVAITAIHITGVRLHNYIEENLHRVNPQWDGETLFQESRRLLIAVFQNMYYNEYLPPVLGPVNMKKYKLNVKRGCTRDHNCKRFNGDVTSSFATAAFRFGHSQVTDTMWLSNAAFTKKQEIPYSDVFFRPQVLYDTHFGGTTCGVEAILLGHAIQRTDVSDRFFSHQITRHMFAEDKQGPGIDLPAVSTQRGRDHGIPGYMKFRKACRLSVAKRFEDMQDIPEADRRKLKNVYNHVDDIDLFPGGMVEKQIYGGIVGPTFACILGQNFRDVKLADRFWFENCGHFSKAQLNNIHQYTFGRYYCDTLVNIEKIQKFPMMVSEREALTNLGISRSELLKRLPLYRQSSNEKVPCSAHPGIDFSLWRETKVRTTRRPTAIPKPTMPRVPFPFGG